MRAYINVFLGIIFGIGSFISLHVFFLIIAQEVGDDCIWLLLVVFGIRLFMYLEVIYKEISRTEYFNSLAWPLSLCGHTHKIVSVYIVFALFGFLGAAVGFSHMHYGLIILCMCTIVAHMLSYGKHIMPFAQQYIHDEDEQEKVRELLQTKNERLARIGRTIL